ncbi:MAG: NADH-quinone oxidoreductase subunit L [Campylobacteraceae bacterium]|nr:NADH-quinone oxidoreductase subunit L [Campylobacteraceae bacterium]
MTSFVLGALFLPLLSALLAGLFAFSKKSVTVGIVCSLLIVISTICSFVLFGVVRSEGSIVVHISDFIYAGFLRLDHSLILDPVSMTMALVVGIVSSVVHIYSIGYMEKDPGFNRFFSYLGLFVFSMLVLVMSDNFVGLFIGWEGVGLCSWLLIGFWYDRKGISWCANEAFIMNRIADLGLLLAMFLIYKNVGSLRYIDVFASVPNLSSSVITWIALLLFIGAMGKSAQFPFHTWLADAMAGPTPVSALIHAATMVTAGVYLVIRANAIFIEAAGVSEFIVLLGAFVALFAASMAVVHDDLKKIIAYSTLSQLGYMFVAAGLGAYWIALFHLATHAFFKSLLFLGAGNVMHAMNDELNIKKMGGLYNYMKPTAILMVIGSLALCGYYPFAGFFSKDKILEAAFSSGDYIIWAVLLISAMLTAFYSFRLIMLVFFGKSKFSHKPHEAKTFMLVALVPLALLAIVAGFFESDFHRFIIRVTGDFKMGLSSGVILRLVIITLVCVIASTLFAIFAYKKEIFKPSIEESKIYKLLKNQYYIPQFYERVFIRGYEKISEICFKADKKVIDNSVDAIAKGLVKLGSNADKMQSGNLSLMLRLMVGGFIALLVLAVILGGK